ncbi:MAG: endonuclease NucS [Candidatus Woesearchaeota archaeon]
MEYEFAENLGKIESALNANDTLLVATFCEVWYFGKVESYLPLGDRIILIKSDKTLLVHQPTGVNPINYMKEGTEHKIIEDKKGVFLKSHHQFQKDYMDIRFVQIHFVQSHSLEDGNKIQVQGSERDMSDMIYANPEVIENGFKPFSREEHTQFGFIDVFGTDKDGKVVVIECKRDMADFKAVSQLHRYVAKIARSKGIKEKDIRGIIASPRISENAKTMLYEQGFEYIMIVPPKYLEKYDTNQKRLGEF